MRAMSLTAPGPAESKPLARVERETPRPGAGEILVRVEVCAVCRTDLHLVEGDLEPRRPGVVPGHQVVGRVAGRGPGAERFRERDRVGIAWLRRTRNATHDPGDPPAPTRLASWHRRAGWAAVTAAGLGFVSAALVLAGMYQRAGLL